MAALFFAFLLYKSKKKICSIFGKMSNSYAVGYKYGSKYEKDFFNLILRSYRDGQFFTEMLYFTLF